MRIFLTRSIPEDGLALIRDAAPNASIEIWSGDTAIDRKTLLARVRGADILCSLLTDKIDADVMDAAGKNLKLIANYAVGFDNIDLTAAKERGITVCNTPAEEVSESVAEHALALMLALAHRIPEADRFTRVGKYHGWSPTLLIGTDLHRKTLGIVGAGAIGTALGRRLHEGFGMTILYHNPTPNPTFERATGGTLVDLTTLLKQSDFVSLHVPLTPETRHLISSRELHLMKRTAFLLNTSRGPVVDEKALIDALQNHTIAGAGLDVYECEPLIDCDPTDTKELRTLDNVVLTPHTASATLEARSAMSRELGKNVVAFLQGKTPEHAVRQ